MTLTDHSMTTNRELMDTSMGVPASDGHDVHLTRLIGSSQLNMLDPFLLLDAFESNELKDYIGGFPAHPHRGFETVTYLLAGRMRHKDNAGHEGIIEPGGIQWMTAGKGIIHSEMPEQQEGLLQGFQLWINLPREAKMIAPAYQEFAKSAIAVEHQTSGVIIRVIAGKTNQGTTGPIINHFVEPSYMDISLPAGESFQQKIQPAHSGFVYVIDGEIKIGTKASRLRQKQLGVLSTGNNISISAMNNTPKNSCRVLFIAGKPLNEPVARGGPFVMNTKAEVLQAFDDFKNNRF